MHEEAKKFFDMLYHDDRNSYYFLCTKKNGTWQQKGLKLDELYNCELDENANCYVSLNGFSCVRRGQKYCRQINALFFDLDYHKPCDDSYLNWIKERTYIIITESIANKELTPPTIITDTTRGLQLFYIFDTSLSLRCKDGKTNSKGLFILDQIQQKLLKELKVVLNSDTDLLELDTQVFDVTRVVRLPSTKNMTTGKTAKIKYINEDYYVFDDFKLCQQGRKQKSKSECNKPFKNTNQLSLQKTRLDELQRLVEYRNYDVEGCRNAFALLYYNSAVQIYGENEAESRLFEFCEQFKQGTKPFTKSELKAIIKSVNANHGGEYSGHYKITKKWIMEHLNVTDIEKRKLNLFKSTNSKKEKVKRENQKRKLERNNTIYQMHRLGFTHSEIAENCECSLRTIQNVLKAMGETREYKKSAEN